MTSKRSFINLRRENIKHRIGMIFITFFFFFLSMLAFLMSVQNICGRDIKTEEIIKGITDLSRPEMGMGLLSMGAAVLLAISSFRYLHSKTEVDLYHSLPIKRREILYIMLTNDIVLFVMPLAIITVFRCAVTATVGYLSRGFLAGSFWSVLCYTAIFAVTYLTMSLAMLMTGNTFIGLLGFCVFAGYSPVVLCLLYPALASTFFITYCDTGTNLEIYSYFSPVSLANLLLSGNNVWKWEEHIVHFAAIGVWIVFLLIINYLLFERRASEMAGKAMAFPRWNPVIRFLLVIPGAVYVGLGLYAVSFTSFKPWIIAGVIIGGFFIHGVIECIYRFDVRGLWSNKRQMLASVAISFLIVAFFWMDLSGFDKYLPREEELSSVVVDGPYTIDGHFWGKQRNGITGDTMKGTLKILDKIIGENDNNKDILDSGTSEEARGYSSYRFNYRLQNGRVEKREYILSPKLQDEIMEQVFDTMEYKKDTYALYTADWSLVTDVEISFPTCTEMLDMTKEQRSELFRIYLEEHSSLDYKTVKNTLPFGQLMISHKVGPSDNNYYSGMAEAETSDAYYLYPSFKKTIKYLREELKVDVKTSMKDISITSLNVSRYKENSEDWESLDIYDEEFIDSIKERLCYGDSLWLYGVEQAVDTSVDITATVKTESGEESYVVYTDSETVEKMKQQGTFE